jgi:hypothetical protein
VDQANFLCNRCSLPGLVVARCVCSLDDDSHLFTTHAPDTLSDDLVCQGHEVYEALAISEVLALAKQ